MAGDFQGFTLEKAEQLSGRLREVLSGGQAYILARFGVDMGLEPDLYSTWIVLSATAVVLLLLLAVSWAAVRGGPLLGKAPTSRVDPRSCVPDKAGLVKQVRAEEPRKRNKKKTMEKKTQSNGQPVNVAPQEVNLTATVLKLKKDKMLTQTEQQPVQVKKNKKKAKMDVKPAQPVITNDWKEPDEGTWETKVSNREKKQQRRKDKGSEDCSPGGPEAPKVHVETPVVTVTAKKNRGNNESRATGKNNTATRAASSSSRDESSVNDDDGWTNVSVKKAEQRGAGRKSIHTAPHLSVSQKHQSWAQETQEPPTNSAELQWASQKEANDGNDEWSGFTRTAPVDPSSDWYAPVEHWGNYEGLAVMAAPPVKREPAANKVAESEKNGEDPSNGAAGAKKRRRRKRNTEGEGATGVQAGKLIAAPADTPAPVSKSQSPRISSSQKGPQHSAQPPKSTQKKKARKEI